MRECVAVWWLCILVSTSQGLSSYKNPVWAEDFADPFILRVGSTYYAYSTNSGSYNIPVLSSPDGSFTNWTPMGDALPTLPSWAQANSGLTWAPSILDTNVTGPSQYVMYYTARYTQSGKQCVSFGVSSTPQGPYVDSSTSPWICQSSIGGSIDASPFVDVNGNVYLVWKNDGNCCGYQVNIWSQQLSSSGTELQGSPVALITNDQPWEGNLVEGPSMVTKIISTSNQRQYFLFYSANNYASYQYAVGYAQCSSPLGPCVKPTYSPIIAYYGNVWGPGGESPFPDPSGNLWFCYHGWTAPNATYPSGARSLRIDRLDFINGVPLLGDHVPTTNQVFYTTN